MTAPLLILAALAAGMLLLGVAYALGVRLPSPLFALTGLAIVLVAAATLVSIVVLDMRGSAERLDVPPSG